MTSGSLDVTTMLVHHWRPERDQLLFPGSTSLRKSHGQLIPAESVLSEKVQESQGAPTATGHLLLLHHRKHTLFNSGMVFQLHRSQKKNSVAGYQLFLEGHQDPNSNLHVLQVTLPI